jgi:hypothetical protein
MRFKPLNFLSIVILVLSAPGVLSLVPVFLKLFGVDRVDVINSKQTSEDIYHSFAFLYPNDEIKSYISSNGIGTFMNISYANLFLRVSLEHSLMMIVSEQCADCDKNVLFNISHSLTGDIYNFESEDCWSNLFVITAANFAKCQVQLNYGKKLISGLLAYDNIYLSAYSKTFTIDNLVLLSS